MFKEINKRLNVLVGMLLVGVFTFSAEAQPFSLASPSGNHVFQIELIDGNAVYSVSYDDQPAITRGRLGFDIVDGNPLGSSVLAIKASAVTQKDETWKPVYGERSTVRDHYASQVFELMSNEPVAVSVEVRAYDQGVAFCYHLEDRGPAGADVVIDRERTTFPFEEEHVTWTTSHAQGKYTQTTTTKMPKGQFDRPQIFEAPGQDRFIALGEARLVDFARMKFSKSGNGVAAVLSSKAKFRSSLVSPWRFVMGARSAGQLVNNNDLLLNLNDPCAIEDTSWIKPGKVLREVTLSNEGAIATIDYCAKVGIEYMLFDAGWYGNEFDEKSDATTVTVDRKRSQGNIDMQKVVKYAKENGVGVILYVNRRSLEKQLDDVLPLLQKWGIAGVKYGFVNVGSQYWTTWLHDAVRKAADHKLMIDIHDEYRPTGYSRTYPNLMTQEGIAGDEMSPTPQTSIGLFFPRFLAGAGDNTVCYFDSRVAKHMNHAYQLGKTVCFYSPLQFVHWYDRPEVSPQKLGGAGGQATVIGDEPELGFFGEVPTVWDDSRVIEGKIQEHVVVARRSGNDWYIGAMNAKKPNSFSIKLDFLSPGKRYTLRSYTHDPSVNTRTKVRIQNTPVTADSTLEIRLGSNDGAAYQILAQ